MKVQFILVMIFTLLLNGCSWLEPEPPREPEIVYKTIYKTKIVKIPVTCDIGEPKCEFKGAGYTPAIKMTECVVRQKKYIKACKGKKLAVTD